MGTMGTAGMTGTQGRCGDNGDDGDHVVSTCTAWETMGTMRRRRGDDVRTMRGPGDNKSLKMQ